MNIALRLIPLSLVVLFAGCASMNPSCEARATAANQRETNSLLTRVLAALTEHNTDFKDAVKMSKEPAKKEDKKPPGKKG